MRSSTAPNLRGTCSRYLCPARQLKTVDEGTCVSHQVAVPSLGVCRSSNVFDAERLREVVPEENGVQCDYRVEFGEPAEGILKAVTRCGADLVVMGIHGAGALVRASTHFGTTTHRVVSLSPVPVLTVRGSDS
jgi:hypothetical protein